MFSVDLTDAGDVLQLYELGGDGPVPDTATMGRTIRLGAGEQRAFTGVIRKPDGAVLNIAGYNVYFAARRPTSTLNMFQHDNDAGSGVAIAGDGLSFALTIAAASTTGQAAGDLEWQCWFKDAGGNPGRWGQGVLELGAQLPVIP